MEFKPYSYQKQATQWILDHPRCGLFLDMGLGKTVCTLSAIDKLIFERLEVGKILVIAPLRVAATVWAQECDKWEHLHDIKVARILGNEKQRLKALNTTADVYVINRENVCWLLKTVDFDFDMVIIDELSSFKAPSAQRFKALKKVIGRAKRVVGLTGTPAPNGLIDLWSQMYLIDKGARLGKTVGVYRNTYFKPGFSNGFVVYRYDLLPGSEKAIKEKISDICISMSKEEYLDMPDRIFQTVAVELPPAGLKAYRDLERDCLLERDGSTITAVNAGAMNNKLQQMANGAVYDENQKVVEVHAAKLDALEDLIEQANGQPVLVFTSYRHDEQRIKARLGNMVHGLKTEADIAAWNRGEYPVAVAHPASIGHGLNLQQGGHICVWFGLTWSLELYQQANDRLYRQGQKNTVTVFHLVTTGTVDEAAIQALESKASGQKALMDYLTARREELKNDQNKGRP